VLVLGMHRSGTSAVTGVLDALGLPACVEEDRFPIRKWNARGNYESQSLSVFDERLMGRLGGAWFAPPDPPPGWQSDPELEPYRVEAARLFAAAHPFERWVWKDPRACVLLPFWDLVLGRDLPRILVLRNPIESAASLAARNHMSRELALAIAERSIRCALHDSEGRPVFVTAYDHVLQDVGAWSRTAATFLAEANLPLPEPLALSAAVAFLDPELRHHQDSAKLDAGAGTSEGLRRIWEWAWDALGIHASLSIAGLPAESPETSERLMVALREFPSTQ
jgi:hypothetical protein